MVQDAAEAFTHYVYVSSPEWRRTLDYLRQDAYRAALLDCR
jgi:hypothetical protein